MSAPSQFQNWPSSIHQGFGPYRAVVDSITDGDTLRVFCDLGLNQYAFHAVRLKDVNAPELFTSDPYEKQLGIKARDALYAICPPGTKCLMSTYKDAMSFSRYIAVLRLSDGTDVNAAMREALVNL